MNDEEIEKIWEIIVYYYNQYLADKGVKLPALKDIRGYTKNALVLIRLAKNYPYTDIVSKSELTDFIKQYYPDVNDVQQARHLSMQSGFNIASGTRGDVIYNIPAGSYKLIDLENPYPAFFSKRREGFFGDWEKIKEHYGYRCATCGSKEGEEHSFRKGVIVSLQKGHMNPDLPLDEGNIIPQCQICNRPGRNKWIYDKTGRVIEVANTEDGTRIVEKFIDNAPNETIEKLFQLLKERLKK